MFSDSSIIIIGPDRSVESEKKKRNWSDVRIDYVKELLMLLSWWSSFNWLVLIENRWTCLMKSPVQSRLMRLSKKLSSFYLISLLKLGVAHPKLFEAKSKSKLGKLGWSRFRKITLVSLGDLAPPADLVVLY